MLDFCPLKSDQNLQINLWDLSCSFLTLQGWGCSPKFSFVPWQGNGSTGFARLQIPLLSLCTQRGGQGVTCLRFGSSPHFSVLLLNSEWGWANLPLFIHCGFLCEWDSSELFNETASADECGHIKSLLWLICHCWISQGLEAVVTLPGFDTGSKSLSQTHIGFPAASYALTLWPFCLLNPVPRRFLSAPQLWNVQCRTHGLWGHLAKGQNIHKGFLCSFSEQLWFPNKQTSASCCCNTRLILLWEWPKVALIIFPFSGGVWALTLGSVWFRTLLYNLPAHLQSSSSCAAGNSPLLLCLTHACASGSA